jgi:formylglycine-generating enzyme required for sulfatase activity
MVSIPGGTFRMGSLYGEGAANEYPQHLVKVNAFEIDANDVTVFQFDACVRAGACSATPVKATTAQCNEGKPDRGCDPIDCVNWAQATTYCGWAGKRLPTEEEWEYAARGTDGRQFPWGNAEPSDDRLCWSRSEAEGTCPVGAFPRGDSPFGVHDMAGNVSQWTASKYTKEYGANAAYAYGAPDPLRALRGSGHATGRPYGGAFQIRATLRFMMLAEGFGSGLGFRCAR